MKREVVYLLKNGFAVPSISPWSSPCILVPKADGSFRFCTDFRKIHSVTVPDAFPLPRIDDCIDILGAAKYITKLVILNCENISQYYCFCCIYDQINTSLLSRGDFLKKKYKSYCSKKVDW